MFPQDKLGDVDDYDINKLYPNINNKFEYSKISDLYNYWKLSDDLYIRLLNENIIDYNKYSKININHDCV